MEKTNIAAVPILPPQADLSGLERFDVQHVEGVRFAGRIENKNFRHIKFRHVAAGKAVFVNCDFSFCDIDDGYFREARFIECNFKSIKCTRSSFRKAQFSQCQFQYAQFQETFIDARELISNAPTEPNLRRELMAAARVNAESLGDTRAIRLLIREELRASREFHSVAWRGNTEWLRKKYDGLERIGHFFKSVGLTLDWMLWGHGEYPWQFIKGMTASVLLLSSLTWFFGAPSNIAPPEQVWQSIVTTTYLFLDLTPTTNQSMVQIPPFLGISIVIFRYVAIGLFTSMIFRLLSHR